MSEIGVGLFSERRRWADMDAWRRDAVALHGQGPVHQVEPEHFDPFWAVIGAEAIADLERRHDEFHNAPEPVLQSRKAIAARQHTIRTLVHMDAPDHSKYRKLGAMWFRPAPMNRMVGHLDELSEQALERLRAAGGECDFAEHIALPYPLRAVLEILGLPESDYGLMLRLTQEMFGQEDPDLRRGGSMDSFAEVVGEIMGYFARLTAERRANPTDDLASAIANGTIDDRPIPDIDTLSYYLIVATAGHDTTSYAMSGGMHALIEHTDQLERLRHDPTLLNQAVEEILRWTSPARHFMRTAQVDTEIAGQPIAAGDWVSDHERAADAWSRAVDVNIKGVVNGIAAVHDQMLAQGRGHVVNISSTYANAPTEGSGVYGATKTAVNMISESLRVEAQGKIKVSIVRPTGVPTTGLGGGIVNQAAVVGMVGHHGKVANERMGQLFTGTLPDDCADPDSIGYFALDPHHVAEAIVYVIDQPWGVSISDITVSASGEPYLL